MVSHTSINKEPQVTPVAITPTNGMNGDERFMNELGSENTHFDTVVITWESCPEPMTDTFAF